ncbi:uncharacterized protein [Diadema antillarum]|uniref:uncharacterized protein n=1 Tax=Diadema antillarum TaxID=105358 RepID=UPI003A8630BD
MENVNKKTRVRAPPPACILRENDQLRKFHFPLDVTQEDTFPSTFDDYSALSDDSEDEERAAGRRLPLTHNSPLVVGHQTSRLMNQTVYHCCRGWLASGRECTKAICTSRCINGKCSAPNVCSCFPGFTGTTCERACPPGRYGPNCELPCTCGSRDCDSVTGRCTPECEPGFMGPSCNMPCPPGRYGPDCVEYCQCPLMVAGEVQCDPLTGNCTEPTTRPPTTVLAYNSTLFERTDTFHEFFQYDTEEPALDHPNRKHAMEVKAMRLGISGAAGVLLMLLSLGLAYYVHRKFRKRACICLQRKRIRTAMLTQQRDRIAGVSHQQQRDRRTPRAHFPNPYLPHAMPYRLPSLCNYTGLRHTSQRAASVFFDPLPGTVEISKPNMAAVKPCTSPTVTPEETIYEVRPSLVAKGRKDQNMSSGYIESNTLFSISRVVQGCEEDVDSVTTSVAYSRNLDEEAEEEEDYDYPYADSAKIEMGYDQFQTQRSRPGDHEHENSIYAVVLENEKAMASPTDNTHSVSSRFQDNARDSDILADVGNHGRTHTDPLPLPSHFAAPPQDGTYTALIANPRCRNDDRSAIPERTPGSGCSSTAPSPKVVTRTPSARVPPSVRPRVTPLSLSKVSSPLRPRGMSDVHHSTRGVTSSNGRSPRSKAALSHVDSNGYTTAIRTFSSLRQARRPATKRKSRPSIELRQTPIPMTPPRISESYIPPLSPDPTGDVSMKTQLVKEDSVQNPRYVNECVMSPKQKPRERTRSRTPALLRRARQALPMPGIQHSDENDRLYDDILPLTNAKDT